MGNGLKGRAISVQVGTVFCAKGNALLCLVWKTDKAEEALIGLLYICRYERQVCTANERNEVTLTLIIVHDKLLLSVDVQCANLSVSIDRVVLSV